MKITIEINEEHERFKLVPGQVVTECLVGVANRIAAGSSEGDMMDLDAVNVCTWSARLDQ